MTCRKILCCSNGVSKFEILHSRIMVSQGVTAITLLSVPMCMPLQEDGFSCVPRCVKMIFMFVQNTYQNCIVPDFDIEKIGKIVKTMAEGTLPEDVLELNKVREVSRAVPSIEFEHKPKLHTLDDIINEIDDRQPPIVWIWSSHDKNQRRKFHHAVVVTGVENGRIYYNDPIFGKKDEEKNDFLAKWHDEDTVLVKVKIGKRIQQLEEFIKDFNNNTKQSIITEEGS